MSSATIAQAGSGRRVARAHRLGFAPGVLAIVGLALLARVIVVLVTPHYVPQTDAADYDRIAMSLAQHGSFPSSALLPGGGPTAFRPPLFPLVLAAVYKLVGVGSQATRWEAARLFEAALGAITVWLTYLIALRLWDRKVALVCGAIAAVYPPLVLIGSSLMTESLFIPLVLAAVLSALIARDSPRSWRWHVLTGLLVGLASLTRGNGIELLLPIGFLVWSGRPRFTWRALRGPVIVVLTTAVTLIPWTVRNEHVLHEFVPIDTQAGYLLAGIYNGYAQHRSDFPALWTPPVAQQDAVLAKDPHLNEAQVASRLQTVAVDYIEAHPASVLKTVYWNALRTLNLPGPRFELYDARYVAYPGWLASASVYAFWVLALVALASAVAGAGRRVPWAFWACPGIVVLTSVLLTGETRYRAPADPFLVMLAAAGLVALQRRRTRRSRQRLVPHPVRVRSTAG